MLQKKYILPIVLASSALAVYLLLYKNNKKTVSAVLTKTEIPGNSPVNNTTNSVNQTTGIDNVFVPDTTKPLNISPDAPLNNLNQWMSQYNFGNIQYSTSNLLGLGSLIPSGIQPTSYVPTGVTYDPYANMSIADLQALYQHNMDVQHDLMVQTSQQDAWQAMITNAENYVHAGNIPNATYAYYPNEIQNMISNQDYNSGSVGDVRNPYDYSYS